MAKRIFGIGDIHGRLDLLRVAFRCIDDQLLSEDIIVMLGDYVDRGSESADVIDFLIEQQKDSSKTVICLRGNHEQMMIDSYDETWNSGMLSSWLQNGGIETLESYGAATPTGQVTSDIKRYIPKYHIDWMKDLPLFYQTENHFFVHAGVNPDRSLDNQKSSDLLWIREHFLNSNLTQLKDSKHVVHGHTPIFYDKRRKQHLDRRTNLDYGAVWTNELTVGVFDADISSGPIDYIYLTGSHDQIYVEEFKNE